MGKIFFLKKNQRETMLQVARVLDTHRRAFFLIGVIVSSLLLVISSRVETGKIQSLRFSNMAVNNSQNIQNQLLVKLDRANLTNIQRYELSFKGKALDSNYGNFFQTDDGQNAIRLELNRPNDLSLIFFDNSEGIFKVTEKFSLNEWHDFYLTAEKNRFVKLFIDSRLVYFAARDFTEIYRDGNKIILPPNLLISDIRADFGNFVIGTGFSRGRDLLGEVSDFSLQIEYVPKWNTWNTLAIILLIMLLFAQIFFTIKRLKV